MSGPKVVRIVTREEIIATCEGQLARLDAAIANWTKRCERADCLDDYALRVSRERREEIAALLQSDEFLALQKQVAQEIAFLSADLDKRLSDASAARAAAASHTRRQADAAKALISALQGRSQFRDESLLMRLQHVSEGRSDPQALAAGFAALSNSQTQDDAAEKRKELAALYGASPSGVSFQSWLETQERLPAERRLSALERRLAELQVTDEANAAPFIPRLEGLLNEVEPRRSLLLDSLEMDLGKVLTDTKTRARLTQELELVLAELREISPESAATYDIGRAQTPALEHMLREIETKLKAARNAASHANRRKALLQGLAALGYETNEGMETVWVKDGRLVLRSAARPDYGVEIAGNNTGARVQMRAVALAAEGAPVDTRRDTEAETIWCGEVSQLKAQLKKDGVSLEIEKASPVGEIPLKRVATSGGSNRDQAREGPGLRTRTLS